MLCICEGFPVKLEMDKTITQMAKKTFFFNSKIQCVHENLPKKVFE